MITYKELCQDPYNPAGKEVYLVDLCHSYKCPFKVGDIVIGAPWAIYNYDASGKTGIVYRITSVDKSAYAVETERITSIPTDYKDHGLHGVDRFSTHYWSRYILLYRP